MSEIFNVDVIYYLSSNVSRRSFQEMLQLSLVLSIVFKWTVGFFELEAAMLRFKRLFAKTDILVRVCCAGRASC